MSGPTRTFSNVGYRLTLLIPARWNRDMFAGVCLALGCPREQASRIAADLETNLERKITIRAEVNREVFRGSCATLGISLEDIPPL